MYISLKWLKELLPTSRSAMELAKEIGLRVTEVASTKPMVKASNLVVGFVKECIKHPQADKLSVCQVDIGNQIIQIVCGAPNVAQGQKVIVALVGAILPGDFHITKATIRGVESNGMICSLSELGIAEKFHNEDGIHELPLDTQVGVNPLEVLHYDDDVIELDLTPNKGYLLSYLGVAYEVAALEGLHVMEPKISLHEIPTKNRVSVSTETKECRSYYARVIQNITIKESPYWLKARLIQANIRPINNVVDITNYVMLEMGQPLHAFDYDKLKQKQVVVRLAHDQEQIQTLDGVKRSLLPDDIVITDGQEPIALAGVMGGFLTQVDETTKTILLESAVFDPQSVRKTSRRLDLRSESSTRFEKGIDPFRTKQALDRAAMLFEELAGGEVLSGVSVIENHQPYHHEIRLSCEKINRTLGTNLDASIISSIWEKYQFLYHLDGSVFTVNIPSRRRDLVTDQDLMEEVVRLIGFEQVPTTLVSSNQTGTLSAKQKQRRLVQDTMRYLGFDEVVTYSLTSKEKAVQLDQEVIAPISLMHPMTEERSTLRHSLLPSLIETVVYNKSRKNPHIHLFEIGRGYFQHGEVELLSGVVDASTSEIHWQDKASSFDFYDLSGIIDAILQTFGIVNQQFQKPSQPNAFFHPGIVAEIIIDDIVVGQFGRLHPEVEKTLGLSKTFAFEINLDLLYERVRPLLKMREIAKYPSVSRDIAVVVDESVLAGDLLKAIQVAAKPMLEVAQVFDIYRGAGVPSGKKSIAMSFIFQDYQKTLDSSEVDQLMNTILQTLESQFQASLRQ